METRRENMNKHEAPRGGLQLSPRHLLCFSILLNGTGASLGAQLIKNPSAMQKTWVPFMGWEDHLEKK